MVRTTHAAGPVYLLDKEDGNSGGNVATSIACAEMMTLAGI